MSQLGIMMEDSLLLDHDKMRHSLPQKQFGPPTPRHKVPEEFEGRRRVPKRIVDRNLRRCSGVHSRAPRPASAADIGVADGDGRGGSGRGGTDPLSTISLDYRIGRSVVATPWAHHNPWNGRAGTDRGFVELRSEVTVREALRGQVRARRAMDWEQARPYVLEFLRVREPPSRAEIDAALDADPDTDVSQMVGARARRIGRAFCQRFAGRLQDARAHLKVTYGEDPIPTQLSLGQDARDISRRIAQSQVHLRAPAPSSHRSGSASAGPLSGGRRSAEPRGSSLSFVPSGRGFRKMAPSATVAELTIHTKVAAAQRVDRTLASIQGAYFPPSRRWGLRRADRPLEPARLRATPLGSGVVFAGQGSAWRNRHTNEARQLSQLTRSCVLGVEEIEHIKGMLASLAEDANPSISFKRFFDVMKAIGVGGEVRKNQTWAADLRREQPIQQQRPPALADSCPRADTVSEGTVACRTPRLSFSCGCTRCSTRMATGRWNLKNWSKVSASSRRARRGPSSSSTTTCSRRPASSWCTPRMASRPVLTTSPSSEVSDHITPRCCPRRRATSIPRCQAPSAGFWFGCILTERCLCGCLRVFVAGRCCLAGLRRFKVHRMFQTLVHHLSQHTEGEEETISFEDVKRAFGNIDLDHDGMIEFDELYSHVAKHPDLLRYIAESSIAFSSPPGTESRMLSPTSLKHVLLEDTPGSPTNMDGLAAGAGAGVGQAEAEALSTEVAERGGDSAKPATRESEWGGVRDQADSSVSPAVSPPASLFEQRHAARRRSDQRQSKRAPRGRRPYRSQGVTGNRLMPSARLAFRCVLGGGSLTRPTLVGRLSGLGGQIGAVRV
jgi:hypothetical protein